MAVFLIQAVQELAMVIPIDALRCGVGFDAAGIWHEAESDYRPGRDREAEIELMAPARGAAWGLLASAVLWAGLVGAARAIFTLIR
jgi:hypothetical protein